MDIDLELFRTFEAVAKTGSFSAAADELFVSQPAISQSVKRMEEQLGLKLFTRTRKGTVLTPEGNIIYSYVSTALKMIETGIQRAQQRTSLHDTELRIAAGNTFSRQLLIPALREFASSYPNVAITLAVRSASETISMLNDRRIDLGFVDMPCSSSGIIFEKCFSIHDIFIAGRKFNNLRGRTVPLQELSTYPIVMPGTAARARRWVDSHFNAHGAMLSPIAVFDSHDMILDYISTNPSIACVAAEFAAAPLHNGEFFRIELEYPVPERGIGFCYRTDTGLSSSAKKFIALVGTRV